MGKDLKGKELGVGISQRSDGFYVGRFTVSERRDYENPCKAMVKSDIGKPAQKKEALTLEQQKRNVSPKNPVKYKKNKGD